MSWSRPLIGDLPARGLKGYLERTNREFNVFFIYNVISARAQHRLANNIRFQPRSLPRGDVHSSIIYVLRSSTAIEQRYDKILPQMPCFGFLKGKLCNTIDEEMKIIYLYLKC